MCAFQIPMNMDYDVMTKIGEQSKVIRERKYQVERFEEHAPHFSDCPRNKAKFDIMRAIRVDIKRECPERGLTWGSHLRMITREPRLRLIRKRWREIGMVGSLPLHTAEAHEERWLRENWC